MLAAAAGAWNRASSRRWAGQEALGEGLPVYLFSALLKSARISYPARHRQTAVVGDL